MANQIERSRTEFAALKPASQAPTAFGGAREGLEASLTVLRDWPAFLQIAAPWAIFLCASLYWLSLFGNSLGHDTGRAELLLVAVLLLLILIFVSIPTVAVAWFRWIIRAQLPPNFLALPNRAVLSLLWRVGIFASALGTADRLATGKGAEIATSLHLPSAALVGNVAGWVIDIAAVMLASSFALRFPAMAVGDATFTRNSALVQGRRMWPGLPIGLILSLAPFFIVGSILDALYDGLGKPIAAASHHAQTNVSAVSAGLMAMGLLAMFAAVASAATFLSRAYIAARARIGLGTEST